MRLDRFDLNLLVALDTLVEERSVTAAARRLHLTQSAMSGALARLRIAFDDPLLVRHGRGMVPTPAALALAPRVKGMLDRLRQLIEPEQPFDATTSARAFRVVASDYISTVLLAPLIRRLEAQAPHVRVDITLPSEGAARLLSNGELDLLLTPAEFVQPDHPSVLLFEERHVVIGCAANPALRDGITRAQFAHAGHVAVRIDGRNTYIENELARLGVDRRIEIHAPSFMQVPWLIPGTRRIALMHERLARQVSAMLGLMICEPPFHLPAMREMMQFHSARRDDQGLQWLMDEVRQQATAQMGAISVTP